MAGPMAKKLAPPFFRRVFFMTSQCSFFAVNALDAIPFYRSRLTWQVICWIIKVDCNKSKNNSINYDHWYFHLNTPSWSFRRSFREIIKSSSSYEIDVDNLQGDDDLFGFVLTSSDSAVIGWRAHWLSQSGAVKNEPRPILKRTTRQECRTRATKWCEPIESAGRHGGQYWIGGLRLLWTTRFSLLTVAGTRHWRPRAAQSLPAASAAVVVAAAAAVVASWSSPFGFFQRMVTPTTYGARTVALFASVEPSQGSLWPI